MAVAMVLAVLKSK